MGSRRLQEPAGTCGRAPGCGQPPLSMVRTRAASGAAGEGLRPGRYSRQPARPPQISQRNGEQHPSGAPFVSRPFQTQLQRERERGDTKGRRGRTAQARAAAEDAGSGGPSAPRSVPSRAGPQPRPGSCACAPTSASPGPALSEPSSRVLGRAGGVAGPDHTSSSSRLAAEVRAARGLAVAVASSVRGPYLYRAGGGGGNAVSLEDGGPALWGRVPKAAAAVVWRLARPRRVLSGAGRHPAAPGRRAAPPSGPATECQTPSKSFAPPAAPAPAALPLSPPRPRPPATVTGHAPRAGRPRGPPPPPGPGR